MTQVAAVTTDRPTLRAEIDGWTFEDSDLLVKRSTSADPGKIAVGFTPAPSGIPLYGTILEMLADGWDLLGPPSDESWTNSEGREIPQFTWWLTRKAGAR